MYKIVNNVYLNLFFKFIKIRYLKSRVEAFQTYHSAVRIKVLCIYTISRLKMRNKNVLLQMLHHVYKIFFVSFKKK